MAEIGTTDVEEHTYAVTIVTPYKVPAPTEDAVLSVLADGFHPGPGGDPDCLGIKVEHTSG